MFTHTYIHKFYNKYNQVQNKMRIMRLKIFGAKIGDNVKSFGRFTVMNEKNLKIGDNSTLNEGVHINCRDSVTIGKNVRLSTNVQIHTGKLIIDSFPRIHIKAPIVIHDNVWIASGTVISAGITIGKNSVIGANSVVLKDVEKNSFYAGNPAMKIKSI